MKKYIIAVAIVAVVGIVAPKTEASANLVICHNNVTETYSDVQGIIHAISLIAHHQATFGACPVVEAPKHRGHYATLVRLGILAPHTTVSTTTVGTTEGNK